MGDTIEPGSEARRGDRPFLMILGRFLAMAFAFAAVLIIARGLGPSGRGVTASLLSVVTVAPVVVGAGVPLAARRRIALGVPVQTVVGAARLYALAALAPALALGLTLQATLFARLPGHDRLAFLVGMATVPLAVSWSVDQNVLITLRQYRRVGVLSVLQPLLNAGALGCLLLLDALSVASVVYSALGATTCAWAVGRAWVGGPNHAPLVVVRDLVRDGIALAGGRLAEVSTKRLDQALALPLMGATAAGMYSVSASIASLSAPIPQTLGATAFGELVADVRSVQRATVRKAVALAVMTSTCLAPVAFWSIPIVFGPEYSGSRPVVLVAIAASAATDVSYVCSMALGARGSGARMTTAQLIGAVVGLGAFIPMAAAYGAVGGATGILLGAVVTLALLLRQLHLSPADVVPRPRDFPSAIRTLGRA